MIRRISSFLNAFLIGPDSKIGKLLAGCVRGGLGHLYPGDVARVLFQLGMSVVLNFMI
jgi:hypothetical protein